VSTTSKGTYTQLIGRTNILQLKDWILRSPQRFSSSFRALANTVGQLDPFMHEDAPIVSTQGTTTPDSQKQYFSMTSSFGQGFMIVREYKHSFQACTSFPSPQSHIIESFPLLLYFFVPASAKFSCHSGEEPNVPRIFYGVHSQKQSTIIDLPLGYREVKMLPMVLSVAA
jgi:hypothetical protein